MNPRHFRSSVFLTVVSLLMASISQPTSAQSRVSGRSRDGANSPGSTGRETRESSDDRRDIGRTRPTEPTAPRTPSTGSQERPGRPDPQRPPAVEVKPSPPRQDPVPDRPPYDPPTVIVIEEGATTIDAPAPVGGMTAGFWVREGVSSGRDVTLGEASVMPEYSGYDFSEILKRSFDHPYTDMFFEDDHGEPIMRVREDSEIMDVGGVVVPSDAIFIPRKEWSREREVPLSSGHEYVVRTWDHHYAKFFVTRLGDDRLSFDWAYQCVSNSDREGLARRSSNTPMLAR